jgi:hypothetical protein
MERGVAVFARGARETSKASALHLLNLLLLLAYFLGRPGPLIGPGKLFLLPSTSGSAMMIAATTG